MRSLGAAVRPGLGDYRVNREPIDYFAERIAPCELLPDPG
jgi:hypothetical protein